MAEQIHKIGSREELRQTFDRVAQLYDEMRPSYPSAVFDEVVARSCVSRESSVLEIGCGTGHATREFAARGLAIDCIEIGENLAAIARRRLAGFPRVSIEIANFDTWTAGNRYDLVYAATAYHWLDPGSREEKIAGMLKPRAWLAFWRNRHIRNGSCDDFLDETQGIYAAEAPELVKERARLPGPDEILELEREEISRQLFAEPLYSVHFWNMRLSASDYARMLGTHSNHLLLAEEKRRRLLDRIEALIATRYGGFVIKDYATVLQMAQRR